MNSTPPSHHSEPETTNNRIVIKAPMVANICEHALAHVRIVGDRSQDGEEEDLEHNGNRDTIREERVRRDRKRPDPSQTVWVGFCRVGRQGRQVGTEEHGADRGAEGRIGPVVHGPAKDFSFVVGLGRGFGQFEVSRRIVYSSEPASTGQVPGLCGARRTLAGRRWVFPGTRVRNLP